MYLRFLSQKSDFDNMVQINDERVHVHGNIYLLSFDVP